MENLARGIKEAAQKAGVLIPTFCYHKNLLPFGACRLCVVEVEQMKGSLSRGNSPDPSAFERANYMKALQSYDNKLS